MRGYGCHLEPDHRHNNLQHTCTLTHYLLVVVAPLIIALLSLLLLIIASALLLLPDNTHRAPECQPKGGLVVLGGGAYLSHVDELALPGC